MPGSERSGTGGLAVLGDYGAICGEHQRGVDKPAPLFLYENINSIRKAIWSIKRRELPMSEFITRQEHEEFRKGLEQENKRQNHRIGNLENAVAEIGNTTKIIERLAVNMEHIAKEQEKQGARLEALESRDGKMWRKVVGYLITAVIGGVVTYVLTHVGL